jgi:hypothetical protein
MSNLILPDVAVTVTNNIDGLIHVYEIKEFYSIYQAKDETEWYIWTQNGWDLIKSISTNLITENNVLTQYGDSSDLLYDKSKYQLEPTEKYISVKMQNKKNKTIIVQQWNPNVKYQIENADKIKRTRFVCINNNRSLLKCSENTNLLRKIKPIENKIHNSAKEISENYLIRDLSNIVLSYNDPKSISVNEFHYKTLNSKFNFNELLLAQLPKDGFIKTEFNLKDKISYYDLANDSFLLNIECNKCNNILKPNTYINYSSKNIYCDDCFDGVIYEFNNYWSSQCEKRNNNYKFKFKRTNKECEICNTVLSDIELYNFYYEENDIGTHYAHCNSCWNEVIKKYDRNNYVKKLLTHPFEILSFTENDNNKDLASLLFRNLDPGGGGGPWSWGLYKCFCKDNIPQMIMILGNKLRYKYLNFKYCNSSVPWFHLFCTKQLAKYYVGIDNYPSEIPIKMRYKENKKEFKNFRHYTTSYYYLDVDKKNIYLLDEDTNYGSRYELPFNAYNIKTHSGFFQAGIGGIVISN